jgi:hypothetical protein
MSSSGSSSVVLAVFSMHHRRRLYPSKQELVELALHRGLYYACLNRRLVPQQVESSPSS